MLENKKLYIAKINLIWCWIKNIKNIYRLREFFVFYLSKFSDFSNLPKDKKYLLSHYGFVGSYCSRLFADYAPMFMNAEIKNIAEKTFNDKPSKDLYELFFLRQMYCAHFIDGWEKYYDDDKTFLKKLDKIKAEIASEVKFMGNLFFSKKTNGGNFYLTLKNGKNYILPINWFEISVFLVRLGLPYLDQNYTEYLNNGDVVDVGAFVGDSSIVLSEYTKHKVLAIESCPQNFALLKKTIALNNLSEKIVGFNVALDKEDGNITIVGSGAGARIEKNKSSTKGTQAITLDNLLNTRTRKISLIKLDVEGYEMNILLGSDNIIKNDRPILLISIYHSGEQFINIPRKMKERYGDIYDFRFVDCNPVHPLAEKVLMCLPKKV